MKIADVERALVAVAKEALTDPEAATSRERALLLAVLQEIGQDETVSGGLARVACKTFDLQFRRIG